MRSVVKLSPLLVLANSQIAKAEPDVNWDAENPNTLNFFLSTPAVGAKVGTGEIIDIQSEKTGAYDAGFVCSIKDISSLVQNDLHITRIEPIVSKYSSGAIVHHMDLFACEESPLEEFNSLNGRIEQSEWCAYDSFLNTACKQILWAYDKGADAFDFPQDTGIVVGPSSGYNTLLFQIHYLLPEDYVPDGQGFDDTSGFRLITEPIQRPHDLGLFGFVGVDINIPPGETSFEYRAHLTPDQLADCVPDFKANNGKVFPVAVHLHGHDHLISARLEHYRNDVLIGTYGEINPYHGYGQDQTFFHLNGSPTDEQNGSTVEPLLEGDSLTFVCTYDSSDEIRNMRHGVSHGDEMCAPLVLYYPKARGHAGLMNENVAMVYHPGNIDLAGFEDEA
jgi:hypothetical protein